MHTIKLTIKKTFTKHIFILFKTSSNLVNIDFSIVHELKQGMEVCVPDIPQYNNRMLTRVALNVKSTLLMIDGYMNRSKEWKSVYRISRSTIIG